METTEEKLSIDERKIIDILLKQLMVLKNDCAYFKNKAGLNNALDTSSEVHLGINDALCPPSNIQLGINDTLDTPSNVQSGINDALDAPSNVQLGIKDVLDTPSNVQLGIKDVLYPPSHVDLGTNNLIEALSHIGTDANRAILLYSFFEQQLIIALDQYINMGSGANTLYYYYSDFVKAVNETNLIASKVKEAVNNLPLEETHVLPAEIPANDDTLTVLELHLRGYLSERSRMEVYENTALEMLYLHNNGKAKQAQLREVTGISVSGFAKHIRRLKQYGLIKELPSKYYALSDKSIHVLLKLYGKPKNK